MMETQTTPQKTALVVEDDLDSQILYKHSLKLENFRVDVASNGQMALDYLNSHPAPDVIFLDLSMPTMTGKEFMAKLRENPDWDMIRVIVISGWDDLQNRSRDIGADGFIRKPFNRASLHDEIARCY